MAHNFLTKSLLKLTDRLGPTSINYMEANGLQRKPTQKVTRQAFWLLPSVTYKWSNRRSKEITGFSNIRLS